MGGKPNPGTPRDGRLKKNRSGKIRQIPKKKK